MNFNVPDYAFNLPWFIFDLANKQLITTRTVPENIRDSKNVTLTETAIPGLNYNPVQNAGNGNRKINLKLKLVKRNNTIGNSLLLQQFAALRNQSTELRNVFSKQFKPNPKVLYVWGTGSVPLIYFVAKCDFDHKARWFNQQSNPQFTEVDIELILDESHPIYRAEEMYRMVSIFAGQAQAQIDNVQSALGVKVF